MGEQSNAEVFDKLSVIVPVYNGEETIAQCLDALLNQDYPSEDYEIIVVNDGSTDRTREIVEQYPVRLINLDVNQGRIVTRETGARLAKYDLLVFNDVRVVPERELLKKVSQRRYQPLMPDVKLDSGEHGGFERLFCLIRHRLYRNYYRLFQETNELWIDQQNFLDMPKGTGNFVCSRELWLTAQPKEKGKQVSDDTKILADIVKRKMILRSSGIWVHYLQRTEFRSVLRHIFQRGPLFADCYLVPGGRYYRWYLLIWAAIAVAVGLAVLKPWLLWVEGGLVLVAFIGLAVYLSEKVHDVFVVLTHFPPVVIAFGLGILWGKTFRLVGRVKVGVEGNSAKADGANGIRSE
jgi:glycosyltransferase involved in cell wall biosynthesis